MSATHNLILLMELAPKLVPPITYSGLNRLSNMPGNDFPAVKRTIANHKFYDADEVIEWYTLYKRATVNKGRRRNG